MIEGERSVAYEARAVAEERPAYSGGEQPSPTDACREPANTQDGTKIQHHPEGLLTTRARSRSPDVYSITRRGGKPTREPGIRRAGAFDVTESIARGTRDVGPAHTGCFEPSVSPHRAAWGSISL